MALGDGLGQQPRGSAEINIVPLVDVILVLLVIFIVTAPMITQAVKVNLPEAESQPMQTPTKPVVVAIAADGQLHWDGRALSLSDLETEARVLATARPDAELYLEADRTVVYDVVAQVLAAATRAGVARISFVTDPGAARAAPRAVPAL